MKMYMSHVLLLIDVLYCYFAVCWKY